jgi:hypothetical protein
MNSKKTIFFILLVICQYSNFSFAQNASSITGSNHSYFRLSGNYLSNTVFYGRKDSLPLPYLTPAIGYYDKSGFYLAGSLSFLTAKTGKGLDMGALDIGYEFSLTDQFSGTAYANKSWYKETSNSIKNDIKGSVGSLLSYDLGLLQANAGIDFTFATKTDIAVNLGLSHLFTFGKESNQFSLEPSFITYWSSLYSYEGYISRRAGKRPGSPNQGAATITAVTSVQDNKMTLLDYELYMPLTYETKKLGFIFTPGFAIPKNPIYTNTVITTKFANGSQNIQKVNSTPSSELNLTSTFFAELEFFIKF